MITWRDEGERSVAILGEVEIGAATLFKTDGWLWEALWGLIGEAPTNPAAKSALEAAMADWLRRAGLVSVPAGHVIVPREPTEEMLADGDSAIPRAEPDHETGIRMMGREVALEAWRAMIATAECTALKEDAHD